MATNTMVITPRISEQTYQQSARGVYVFKVPTDANKQTVKEAVQSQFDVTVTKVNITKIKGKMKPSSRRGQRPVMGARTDMKKAYVTLKSGDKIDVFEGVE